MVSEVLAWCPKLRHLYYNYVYNYMPLISYISHDLTFKNQNTRKYTVNSYRATAKTCPAQAANLMNIAIQSTYIFCSVSDPFHFDMDPEPRIPLVK